MSAPTYVIRDAIEEGSHYTYAPTEPLAYSNGDPVVEGHIQTFTVTLVDENSGTVIRNAADFLTLGGNLTVDGMLTLPLTHVDTVGIGPLVYQPRLMTFELVTTAGIHKNWEVQFTVKNFAAV